MGGVWAIETEMALDFPLAFEIEKMWDLPMDVPTEMMWPRLMEEVMERVQMLEPV